MADIKTFAVKGKPTSGVPAQGSGKPAPTKMDAECQKNEAPPAEPVKQDQKLGQILIDMKVCTVEQIAEALAAQQKMATMGKAKLKLGQVLLLAEMVKMEQLQEALRQQVGKANASREFSKLAFKTLTEEQDMRKSLHKARSETKPERTSWFQKLFKKS